MEWKAVLFHRLRKMTPPAYRAAPRATNVDTSVAHLADALGAPIWPLNRFDMCWQWPQTGDDSPWYPTLRVFRQPDPGDWETVMTRAAEALAQWVGP